MEPPIFILAHLFIFMIYEEFNIHLHGISSFILNLKTLRVTSMEGKVLVKIPKSIEYLEEEKSIEYSEAEIMSEYLKL